MFKARQMTDFYICRNGVPEHLTEADIGDIERQREQFKQETKRNPTPLP